MFVKQFSDYPFQINMTSVGSRVLFSKLEAALSWDNSLAAIGCEIETNANISARNSKCVALVDIRDRSGDN